MIIIFVFYCFVVLWNRYILFTLRRQVIFIWTAHGVCLCVCVCVCVCKRLNKQSSVEKPQNEKWRGKLSFFDLWQMSLQRGEWRRTRTRMEMRGGGLPLEEKESMEIGSGWRQAGRDRQNQSFTSDYQQPDNYWIKGRTGMTKLHTTVIK